MNSQKIRSIRISEIKVINPRPRNRKTFQGIVNNIGAVGLKKPITVFARNSNDDGTRYDLVCGQGRLEAMAALGNRFIPAIVIEASLKERHLMSLIENVARKRPPLSDLLQEIRRLKQSGNSNRDIARKLGMGYTYVDGIVRLLKQGEDRLVEHVEAGTIPLSVAVKIAASDDAEIQRALNDAYAGGELRGAKLFAVQRILARRGKGEAIKEGNGSRRNMALEYERQTQRHRDLVAQAALVRQRLALLSAAFKRLLQDSEFLLTLRSEGLDSMPEQLAVRLR